MNKSAHFLPNNNTLYFKPHSASKVQKRLNPFSNFPIAKMLDSNFPQLITFPGPIHEKYIERDSRKCTQDKYDRRLRQLSPNSNQNRSEFGRKNFPTTVGTFYPRIRLDNSDFLPINQLNVQRRTLQSTLATSLYSDRNRSQFNRKKILTTVETFYLWIQSENFDLRPIN